MRHALSILAFVVLFPLTQLSAQVPEPYRPTALTTEDYARAESFLAAATGDGPLAYLQKVRIEAAKTRLETKTHRNPSLHSFLQRGYRNCSFRKNFFQNSDKYGNHRR